MKNRLAEILKTGGHSLVVDNGTLHAYDGCGVSDLYRLVAENPEMLYMAEVADKVVGKAAAALMVKGGVRKVFAVVASELASELLRQNGVELDCETLVPYIENRRRTGWCPLETRCKDCVSVDECVAAIKQFIKEQKKNE